ncbi:MAG: hypothetical protein RL187_669 [Actinomycetota bacterium]
MSGALEIGQVALPIEELAAALIDIPSVSGGEETLADAIEKILTSSSHVEVVRYGNTVAARTTLGRDFRVVWAGHLDTVPAHGNERARLESGLLFGRGSVDMKSGIAVALKLALEVPDPAVDVTWIFYDNEEVESDKNGLGLFGSAHPDWVVGDFAIVGEPSRGFIEGGCNGTLRVEVRSTGKQAHSARSWMGTNAIHEAAEILRRLAEYSAEQVDVEGLTYREGLNAVGILGGVAGNVIPDSCVVTVNYRFAPSKTVEMALDHVKSVFEGFEVALVDQAPGARPGLTQPVVQEFVATLGVEVAPKFGWTDVARFGQWGIPAVNYGPGDPALAHSDDEHVAVDQIRAVYQGMKAWLSPHKA